MVISIVIQDVIYLKSSNVSWLCKPKLHSHSNFLAYPDHLKPDILVKYESEYMNVVVYVVGTISTVMMIGMYCISYSSAQGSLLVNSWTSLQNVKRGP